MLVDFKVKNCLSYKEETLFSMVSGTRVRKLKDTHTMSLHKISLVRVHLFLVRTEVVSQIYLQRLKCFVRCYLILKAYTMSRK